jgi:hypothetical protein
MMGAGMGAGMGMNAMGGMPAARGGGMIPQGPRAGGFNRGGMMGGGE